ncbi:heavy metal-binding domain-containing protein, partial [Candidatus Bipolaricaulota bacterium]|nr:heavy metal-binding domain-containing protein [Candidatus Bipolaricaulota bacterium]
ARDEALSRMVEEAEGLDADGIVEIRFTTSQTMGGAAEILVYGTAVKFK